MRPGETLLAAAVVAASVGALVPAAGAAPGARILVPGDVPTVELAIERAKAGDTILLSAGTYPGGYTVPEEKHDLTIRGVDRNEVVLDGDDRRHNGVVVRADGVSILNMSAHNFRGNAFYWIAADRYRASYLTIWNVGLYGIYAEDSSDGVIDHDYVSGAADAAYYVGECRPCRATIANVVAKLSAVGYSGTNASGVVIRDSHWDQNGAGILPNTYANEALAPQSRTTILRNRVTGSGRARVPIHTALAGFIGIGIGVAGGNANVISRNRVTGSERFGIAVFPTARYVVFSGPEPGPPWRPRRNHIAANAVFGSGRADLALSLGSGKSNCFVGNRVRRVLPRGLEGKACASAGDASVATALERPVRVMVRETMRRRQPPPYTAMPAPPPQRTMPG